MRHSTRPTMLHHPVAAILAASLGWLSWAGSQSHVLATPAATPRFADWCLNQQRLSTAQQQTIQALLEQAGSHDCQQAEQTLSQTSQLSLHSRQLTDLSPLATLPHLTSLDLSFNQISDLRPLSSLPNLSFLLLAGNQITDVRPLANLSKLTYLVLEQNQITQISALAPLTQLKTLILLANPIANKQCPVHPATTCIFSNDGQDLYAEAEAHYQKGELQAAIAQFHTVLAVYQQAGDRIKQGDTLNRLGDTSLQLGHYAQALEFYQAASRLRQELGDLPGTGVSLTSMATALERLGQYPKASETLQQALANLKAQAQSGIPLEGGIYELPKDEGNVYNSLALVQNRLGQHQAALQSAQAALKRYQLLPDGYDGKRFGERAILDTLGMTYHQLGQPQPAIATLQQAVAIARDIRDRAGEAASLNHLGEVHLALQEYATALDLFQQSLTIRQAIGDQPGIGTSLHNIGVTQLRRQNVAPAVQSLLAAIQIWETLRPGLTDDTKVALVETQVATYGYLQQALLAQNQTEQALTIAERGRARAFVELLASRLGGQVTQPTTPPLTVEQIRQVAKTHQATLVAYSIVGEQLFIWVVAPNGVITLRRTSLKDLDTSLEEAAERSRVAAETGINRGSQPSRPDWQTVVRQTRSWEVERRGLGIQTNESLRAETSSDSSIHLRQSYQLLIAPIADLLPNDPNAPVIFIPHGPLFLVPFPALQDPTGRYLITQHVMATAPSIQVLALAQSRPATQSPTEALVVGNPTMPSLSLAFGASPKPLDPLPGAEAEATAVAQLLHTHALTGAAAQKPLVLQRMQTARVVHLATHGLLDELSHLGLGAPGAIVLAAAAGQEQAALLTTNEILDLKLKADLVVLSACNTGRGTVTGDGVIGLSRSFLAAGVARVVVSLWAVPDAPTSELMVEFYRQLSQQPNQAQALRQAMLTTMKQHPNPRDWAAFTLIGAP